MILVSRLLQKKKDGKPRFPHIDGVVYFSCRIRSKNEGLPFWLPGTIARDDRMMPEFQAKLRDGWFAYLSKIARQPVMEVSPNTPAQPGLTRVRVQINGRIEEGQHTVSVEIFCLKDDCARAINVVSDSAETRQWIECPVHGPIGSFENFAEYERTLQHHSNRKRIARNLSRHNRAGSIDHFRDALLESRFC